MGTGIGTTIHAWLKLVTDRMPEPLVNMGTGKTAADRVVVRGGTHNAQHVLWYRSNRGMTGGQNPRICQQGWIGAAAGLLIHLSVRPLLTYLSYHDTNSAQA